MPLPIACPTACCHWTAACPSPQDRIRAWIMANSTAEPPVGKALGRRTSGLSSLCPVEPFTGGAEDVNGDAVAWQQRQVSGRPAVAVKRWLQGGRRDGVGA